MQSLYEVAKFWLLGLFVLSLFSLNPKQIGKTIVWVLANWLLGLLCIYIFAIIAKPGFSGEDAYEWFVSVGIGSPFPLNYGNSYGRFYPLGHIIYNWLIYFPFRSSPIPYLLQNAVMLITGTALLYFSMPRKSTANQIACLCSLLLILQLPDMARIFIAIIYPEKSLYILLAWFLFALQHAEKQKTSYLHYISALVPLVIATYCKEPVFVIGLVYGMGRLLFCYRQDTKAQKLFSSLLIVNAIVFLLLYYSYRLCSRRQLCNWSANIHEMGNNLASPFPKYLWNIYFANFFDYISMLSLFIKKKIEILLWRICCCFLVLPTLSATLF